MRSCLWLLLLVLLLFIKACYGVQYEFCKQEYCHIGKRTWRCKERLNRDESTININLYDGNHNTHDTTNVEAIHEIVYVNDPLLNSNQEINMSNYNYDPYGNKKESHLDVIVGSTLNLSRIKCSLALLFHYWTSQHEGPFQTIRFHSICYFLWYTDRFGTFG